MWVQPPPALLRRKTMKKITLSGVVLLKYEESFDRVKLVQEDGYEIDLIMRFQEAVMNYPDHKVRVGYGVADKPCTEDEMQEGFLQHVFGAPKVGYEKHDYRYSSWTSGTDYDTNFQVGGHNMMNELYDKQGKFMILHLEFEKEKAKKKRK